MWAQIYYVLKVIDDKIWGVPLMLLILSGGFLLTARLGLLQFRRLPLALHYVFHNEESKSGEVTSFQALCTALSATIGTGNIVGVATAVTTGGPGALFWMVLAACVGMATKYAECLLSVKYRVVDEKGHALGGPFYYIERGMGPKWKWLAVLFAFLGTCVGLFGIGTFSQVNGIVSAIQNFFDPDKRTTVTVPGIGEYSVVVVVASLILAMFVAFVVIGGLKRIAHVAEVIVPFMAILYFSFAVLLILFNITRVPAAFVQIISAAFDPKAVTGGVVGSMLVAMQKGVARGIFSNEAGLGTAPIAHAAADVEHPVQQAMYGVFEVFADTIVICTLTALSILVSGQAENFYGKTAGTDLTIMAFGTTFGGKIASLIIAVCIMMFAFSTLLSWSLYGGRCMEFLAGQKGMVVYQAIYVVFVVVGASVKLDLAWQVADSMNALMAVPNLIAVLALSPQVVRITRDYLSKVDQ